MSFAATQNPTHSLSGCVTNSEDSRSNDRRRIQSQKTEILVAIVALSMRPNHDIAVSHVSASSAYEAHGRVLESSLLQKPRSLRHPCHNLSAAQRSLTEQFFDFMMQYSKHRDSDYVLVNVAHFSHRSLNPRAMQNIAFKAKNELEPGCTWARLAFVVSK